MDPRSNLSGTPVGGGPLQTASPDRVNQCCDAVMAATRAEGRDNSVHDKISQFNNLSVAMQSKQLERKTADAALKRAMVGREEAEADLRNLREEMRLLQKVAQEGKERERRVGERLETVMENYGRAKETHAHTQALWEKEIRRARKENFKTQSVIVKLQEELKTARSAVKILEETIEREKERSRVRENEAFTARYQLVGVQEQLDEALERIKIVEQERDAFKTAAKNEEVARIAAEGRIPLPRAEDPSDEFASPKKKTTTAIKYQSDADARLSLTTMDLVSSASSELEIEELTTQVLWERQRADRAQEMVDFLQAECQMHCCPCTKAKQSRKSQSPPQKRRRESFECPAAVEAEIEEREARRSPLPAANTLRIQEPEPEPKPREGIFRTVSEQEAEAIEAAQQMADEAKAEADAPPKPDGAANNEPRLYARTPSVDPPAFALLAQPRTSLESLLHAPHGGDAQYPTGPLPTIRSVPTLSTADAAPPAAPFRRDNEGDEALGEAPGVPSRASPEPRPHTSATMYTVTTTTVPVRDDNQLQSSGSSFGEKLRTPSNGSNALAKIRERRGRVRSAAQAAATPRKVSRVAERRDMSAPTARTGGPGRS
ncbi:PAP2 superfamily protein [Hirsutella rhossiliensis]|uniref:PAP2 superfamily protein n=1 Tax=Hirsutella rhossiliensis TaxID=111463 RepID=A0A9P8SFE8_9HYPO|nr:PAP2 superfamily protein [Hirsutella rhossiliensis]KAH0960843.1 PAP2 superfamily protein [Hirsutella rhossiliensis]